VNKKSQVKKMKKIVAIIFLIITLSVESIEINNLTVTMPSPDAIQVYKNNDHIFSYNCNETGSCNIYTTDIESPKYKMFDGEIQTNSHIKSLSISNIQSFKPFYWMDNQYIQFIVSYGSPNGSYSYVKFFLIDTITGFVRVDTIESDWYKHGLPKAKS
jgi:hypothetical protein